MSSQMGQDAFVIEQLKSKKNGIYVEIGAGEPVSINNTVVLEKDFGWTGISLDVGPGILSNGLVTTICGMECVSGYTAIWNDNRSNPLVICDATNIDYDVLFKEYNLPQHMDYLSVDLEPPEITFEALKIIPFDKYKFNVITFETDYYRCKTTRVPSRELLMSYGYKLIQEDVKSQEDWYIHESLNVTI